MSYFSGLVQNEWMKINSKKQLPLFLAFLFAIFLLIIVVLRYFAEDTGYFMDTAVLTVNLGALFMTYYFIASTAQTVTDEYKDGTIKQLLIRPAGRTTVLMSKLVNQLLVLVVVSVAVLVFALLLGAIFFSLTAKGDSTTLTSLIEIVIYRWVGTLFYGTMAFMLAVLTRSVGISISVPFLLSSIIDGIASMGLQRYSWYKFTYFPHLDWKIYADGGAPYDGATLSFSIFMYAVYMIVMLAIAIWVFKKRDVQ
ncbi:ABC transporter permease [Paenibacillus sp. 481]|uniref:ABC transporter permease n=1 Tax=Paenibacillus sp. 481 TaxID=2835869 RepID=UPI001E44D3BE|nr:ABC transporter permease [Paenibacillus sp. 481]UHA72651.1 ABC transporter permease [Paenibacillus sp. 481]